MSAKTLACLRCVTLVFKRTFWTLITLIMVMTVLMQLTTFTTTSVDYSQQTDQLTVLVDDDVPDKRQVVIGLRERLLAREKATTASTTTPLPTLDELQKEFGDWLTKEPGKVSYPKAKKTYIDRLDIHDNPVEPWQIFHNGITKNHIYDPNDPILEKLIVDLQTQPFTAIYEPDAGTQIKLFMTMANGAKGLFKPMRLGRDMARRGENQFYFTEFERHNAEIAAYHLDRVMGFHRVPPTVGRIFNITRDIEMINTDDKFGRTIFVSPGGNKCFHGNCWYYCDAGHAICGKPDLIEGSLQAMVPLRDEIPRNTDESPWRRTYSKFEKAGWENDPHYCQGLYHTAGRSRFLLDLIDVTIFDFINGNQDRHDIDTFKLFFNESAPFLFDNGRAFGDPDIDDYSILLPLTQCCIVRHSTLQKLLKFALGPKKLSEAFVESACLDLAHPLLTDDFYPAMDRRLILILREIQKCLTTIHTVELEAASSYYKQVVLDDGY